MPPLVGGKDNWRISMNYSRELGKVLGKMTKSLMNMKKFSIDNNKQPALNITISICIANNNYRNDT